MTRFLAAISALFLVCAPAHAYDSQKMKEIFENSSSVVLIEVFKEVGGKIGVGNGTGVVIPLSGVGEFAVLTNNHVVEDADAIYVMFYKRGAKIKAKLIGRDPALDLALLEIPEIPRGVTAAALGDSSLLHHGDEVYALGHPYGVRSVTAGNINALESFAWFFIVSQTPLNPGNSGGPLFNKNREMVAVNTAIVPGGNLVNFSIPINYVKRLLGRLVRERVARHGALGFKFHDAFEIPPMLFEKWGMRYPPEREGIIVFRVPAGSSAAAANINEGDTILKINGVSFTKTRDLEMKVFFDHRPEEKVTLTIKRGEQVFERVISLQEEISIKKKQEQK